MLDLYKYVFLIIIIIIMLCSHVELKKHTKLSLPFFTTTNNIKKQRITGKECTGPGARLNQ